MALRDRFKDVRNVFAFNERAPTTPTIEVIHHGYSSSIRPDRTRYTRGKERSIVTTILNRMALDVASNQIKHVRLDENFRYAEDINSTLNTCITLEANLDQTGRAFIHDIAASLFDEGCIAVVPIDTDINPSDGSYDIYSLRVAKILQWYPNHIRVEAYNELSGRKQELIFEKRHCCIIENPHYAVMNESNSTLQRIIYKLSLLDSVDEQVSSGKLNIIFKLPYAIKQKFRRDQADTRRKELEDQLASNNKYGIGYIDSTESFTQLNQPLENNLLKQIEYLIDLLFSQLGITKTILDGTADEKTMLNYYNRTIEPVVSAIVDEMKRKFLTQHARTQKQSIMAFRDPFRLTPIDQLTEMADKMTRNEIMSSNEMRGIMGMKPSSDPAADELRNKNINQAKLDDGSGGSSFDPNAEVGVNQLFDIDRQLNDLEFSLNHSGLIHQEYASKYYDPVKAHEYYLKNRELKGRPKGQGDLNDQGFSVYQQVMDAIQKARDDQIEEKRKQMQEQIKFHIADTNNQIDAIRNEISQLTDIRKKTERQTFLAKIQNLRDANNIEIQKLRDSFSVDTVDIKDEYATIAQQEIEKIQGASEFMNFIEELQNGGNTAPVTQTEPVPTKAKKAKKSKGQSETPTQAPSETKPATTPPPKKESQLFKSIKATIASQKAGQQKPPPRPKAPSKPYVSSVQK